MGIGNTMGGRLATLLAAAAFSVSAFTAEAEEDAQLSEREAFVIHNVIHIMLHEIGHAVIDQFQLPVIGQEEDAVDAFATLEVLELYDEPQPILVDAAYAMLLSHEEAEEAGEEQNYWGEHDLDAQRAYRIICHAYGLDPDSFNAIAEDFEFDRDRLETCEYDGNLASDSWYGLIENALLELGAAPRAVDLVVADERTFVDEVALLRQSGVMDELQDYIATTFAWPEQVTLAFAACGEANAFYDPEEISVTMCHEFVGELLELAERNGI